MWWILPLLTAGANYMSGRQQAKTAKSQAAANAIAGGGFKEAQLYDPWATFAQLSSGAGEFFKLQDEVEQKKKKLEALQRRRNGELGGDTYDNE